MTRVPGVEGKPAAGRRRRRRRETVASGSFGRDALRSLRPAAAEDEDRDDPRRGAEKDANGRTVLV